MKPRIDLLIAVMCLLDTAITQYEVTHQLAVEANLLMAPLIDAGWHYVWLLKVGLAALVVATTASLWRSLLGRLALRFAFGAHLGVMTIHLVILLAVAGWL